MTCLMASPLAGTRRLLVTVGVLTAFDLLAVMTPAAAQNRLTVDASASVGVATNPFLDVGSTPTAISPTLDLHPSWVSERPLTTLRVEADLQASFYNHDYGTNASATIQGSGTHKLSEYTSINASLGYFNTIVGTLNNVRVPVGIVVPVGSDLPDFVNDPALGGIGRRRQSYQASGNLVSMLSPRDQVEFGVSLSANRFEGMGFNDFNYVTPSLSYSRLLSENFNIGASFAVGLSDYRRTPIGDATVYQPSLTVSRGISERWTLKGSLGAAIVDLTEGLGQSRTTTSLNGSADLCRRDSLLTACFSLSRQTVPSAFQGVRTSTSASTLIGYRMSPTDDLSFTGGYSRASSPLQRNIIGTTRDDSLDFLNVNASYSRRFRPGFSGFVSAGYAKAFGDSIKRDANLTASAGVTYRFNGL
jgi:hypothetical protein